jgi:hypothetical protein
MILILSILVVLLSACAQAAQASDPVPAVSAVTKAAVQPTLTVSTTVSTTLPVSALPVYTAIPQSSTPTAVKTAVQPAVSPAQNTPASQGSTTGLSQPTPLAPDAWMKLPVVPTVSARARSIYQRGLQMGNNPKAFSKVGDCESRTTWFLWDFDQKEKNYDLGPYTELQPVLDYFAGSFGRMSKVAKPGFTAASLMTSLWADPETCQKDETPLGCEYRLQRPGFALIMLGTNDIARPETFEANMRKVIDFTIQQGVLPVLVTKADNLEGDNRINAAIARLANEYDIPLWNFWSAAQDLPDHGLQEDGAHLTWSPNTFGDAEAMKRAWPVRNLTALQVLQALMKGVQ